MKSNLSRRQFLKGMTAAAAALTMTGVLSACGSSSGSAAGSASGAAAGDSIKVGLMGPYTGDVAQYGIAVANGAELYINQVNEAGGINGKQLEIVKYDEKGDATEAINAYQKLVEDGVVGIVGDVTSTPCIAVAQESVNDNMPLVTASATAADVVTFGSNTYRACVTDPFQGQKMADFAADELKLTKVASIYNSGDDYSTGCESAFKEECTVKGVELVSEQGYAAGDVDFNAQLTAIISAGAEAIFCPNYYQDDGKIVTQARQLGFTGAFLGVDGWSGIVGGEEEYAAAADLTDCYFCCSFSATSDDEDVQQFITDYTAAYEDAPANFNALGYDAAMVLLTGITAAEEGGLEAGSDEYKQAVIDAIAGGTVAGVTGDIAFEGTGDPVKSVVIVTITDGAEAFYKNF